MSPRIFLDRLDGKQVSPCLLLDQICYILIVSHHCAVHGNPAGSRHRIHAVRLRHGKIGDQDILCSGKPRRGFSCS